MTTPALEYWFSFDIRRNRKSFMLSMIALFLTFTAICIIWFLFAETARGRGLGLLIFGVPATFCSYLLIAQRLRDFNVSGWFALMWLLINAMEGGIRAALTLAALIVLCGIPGTVGANKFGEDPLVS